MSEKQNLNYVQVEPPPVAAHKRSSRAAPAWWVVFAQELHQLWIGGKAPILLLIFCVLQGALTYFMVNNVSDPTPPKEMLYVTLENAIAFGLLIGLLIGADSISGERERLTLESLLLTPASRRQIVAGKFFAGISSWLAALAVTIPLLALVSQGDEALYPAVVWGTIMGTLMATTFTALGMVISSWCNSNKSSLLVSLVMYVVFYIPTQLPSGGQAGRYGRFLKRINPMESNGHFLEKVLVNNRGLAEFWPWLASPVILAGIVFVLLFIYPVPELDLNVEEMGIFRAFWRRDSDVS
jgi:ABC-2 type transport system permease protein